MNFKHPYEKHLAEKLLQVPPPDDPDQNWQQMKVLLDKDLPRGGGGPYGSYRWWIAGAVIVAVVVGTWFGGKAFIVKEQSNEAVAGTIKSVNNKTAPSVASSHKNDKQQNGIAVPDNTTNQPSGAGNKDNKSNDLPGASYASTTNNSGYNTAGTNDPSTPVTGNNAGVQNDAPSQPDVAVMPDAKKKQAPLTIEEAEKARSSGTANSDPGLVTTNNTREVNETPTNYHNKTTVDRNKIYSSVNRNRNKKTGNNRSINNHHTAGAIDNKQAEEDAAVVSAVSSKKEKNKRTKSPVNRSGRGLNRSGSVEQDENLMGYKPRLSLPSQPTSGSGLQESPVTYAVNYTNGTVVSPSGVLQREFTYYTEADLGLEKLAKKKAAARKPWHRSPSSSEDKTFALGLSLPLGFPIGDQQPLGYNRNAGVNAISDYIPSPHFQYHFNNRTYIQADVQFSQPQFIRPFLLYQDQHLYQQGPNLLEQTTSISARKLYYLNLPLTIYHSPLRNFYMGTGLQYSSLLSGVAFYEKTERRVNGVGPSQQYVIKNYFSKFRNDSLSSRLNGNEVRLLIDLNYYWSRFTVGLQYNQAFNNYMSFQVTPSSPYMFDKNKSLQFYLRYNIWEDKKRKQPKGQTLTLK